MSVSVIESNVLEDVAILCSLFPLFFDCLWWAR